MHTRTLLACLVAAVLAGVGLTPGQASADPDTSGSEHWLMFETNFDARASLSLFITAETAATGTVSGPGLSAVPFSVAAGGVTSVSVPTDRQVTTSDGTVTDQGVHVVADAEVTVYGLNQRDSSTDAFLGLPVDILGTDYVVLDAPNTIVHSSDAAQFGVVATQDGTRVRVEFHGDFSGTTKPKDQTVTLDAGQTYQYQNTGSGTAHLSGTVIHSSAPVAVFAGNRCTNIPGDQNVEACDHVVEQLFPKDSWGTRFLSSPLKTRTGGDTFRVVAGTDGTEVFRDGVSVANLDSSEVYEDVVGGAHLWETTEPVLMAQYSNSSEFDGVTSDPFMMLLPPLEQFLSSYTVSTPPEGIANNFVNVVARSSATGSVRLDGSPVPASSFATIGSSGYSAAALSVSVGSHTISASEGIGVTAYGFDDYDSYGYPGGLALAPIAKDTDGDALPDDWETNGVDYDGDGTIDLDLAAMGADPAVPDLFIEIDWMKKDSTCVLFVCWGGKSFEPQQAAVNDVVAAFASSPDGPIRLHVDAGAQSVMNPKTGAKWGNRSQSTSVPYTAVLGSSSGGEYQWSAFDGIQGSHFTDARREVFHYALFADRYQGSPSTQCPSGRCSSGISRGIPAGAFIVTDGPWADDGGFTRVQERGTLMHEFGHNLDLTHGGGPDGTHQGDTAYKSIMNYAYQLTGIGSRHTLDYSRGTPYDDWANLRYDGGVIGALGADADPPEATQDDSLTYPQAVADDILAAPGDGSVVFEGPQALIPGTGTQPLLFTVRNPSDRVATYTLRLTTGLPVTQAAPLAVAPGGEASVRVRVDTDQLTPGDYALTATLDSSLAGPEVSTVTGAVTAPDPTVPGFDDQLDAIEEAIDDLPASELDPTVQDLLLAQIEAASAPDPAPPVTAPPAPAVPVAPPALMCHGKPATIVGTSGDDVLVGTSGADVIVGSAGDDRIVGGGGDDTICAGAGADKVNGGDGDDRIDGGGGGDKLVGGDGDDDLAGAGGADVLKGSAGRDRLVGGAGRDRIDGGPGRDRERP